MTTTAEHESRTLTPTMYLATNRTLTPLGSNVEVALERSDDTHCFDRMRLGNAVKKRLVEIGVTSVSVESNEASVEAMFALDARTASAFSLLDAIRADDTSIQHTLKLLRNASPISYRERLAARIERLLDAYKEDSDGRVFSSDSLRVFISFLEQAGSLRYPAVTLTPGGDLYASWKQGSSHIFSAQFLKNKQIRFVIMRPNQFAIGQTEQFSGLSTALSLPSSIEKLGVFDWATE